MKNIHITTSAMISILIGVISLLVMLVNGLEIFFYDHPLDLAYLSKDNLKRNRYVNGTITDCVTVPVLGNQRDISGRSGTFVIRKEVYYYYTVPISGDQYIRVWIKDKESLKEMERIAQGEAAEVSFVGKIQAGEPLNTAWYDWNPEFDQSKIVVDYVIWQKTIDAEKLFCQAGFWGIVLAILIYHFFGEIQIIELPSESEENWKFVHNYKDYELDNARRRLKVYMEKEIEYRKDAITGTICIIIGLPIVINNVFLINFFGSILIIYGVITWWTFFINSKNIVARKISRLFSIKTLQDKRAIEESKIEKLEQERED